MGFLKPAWNSKNKEKAIKAVYKLKDQDTLARVAQEAQNVATRIAAIKRLKDENLLAKIAKTDVDFSIRIAAIEKLTDQKALAFVVENDKNAYVRSAVLEKVTNQSVLAGVAKNDEIDSMRNKALNRITEQTVLFDVAKNAKDVRARVEATKRITDSEMLADIAKNDKNSNVLMAVAEKTTDQILAQKIYVDAVKSIEDNYYSYHETLEKITNQSELADVAKNAINNRLRIEAAKKLTDLAVAQKVFADVAKKAKDVRVGNGHVGWDALKMLTDQSMLADTAKYARSSEIRTAAQGELTNQSALIDVAKNAKNSGERLSAIEKITDPILAQELIAAIAMQGYSEPRDEFNGYDHNIYMRRKAYEKLTDLQLKEKLHDELYLFDIDGFRPHGYKPPNYQ